MLIPRRICMKKTSNNDERTLRPDESAPAEAEKCREDKCPNYVPQDDHLESFACQQMHLCRDCYRNKISMHRVNPGVVIEGDGPDYDADDDPYGWIDQFHAGMR
jgi:hypothetical protein